MVVISELMFWVVSICIILGILGSSFILTGFLVIIPRYRRLRLNTDLTHLHLTELSRRFSESKINQLDNSIDEINSLQDLLKELRRKKPNPYLDVDYIRTLINRIADLHYLRADILTYAIMWSDQRSPQNKDEETLFMAIQEEKRNFEQVSVVINEIKLLLNL